MVICGCQTLFMHVVGASSYACGKLGARLAHTINYHGWTNIYE